MHYYIGIDIGTTSTKAVAFSEEGNVIAKESVAYAIQHPHPNFSEQNPEEILEAVIGSIEKIAGSLPEQHAMLVSFSAAMHSLLAVDQLGKPITPCMIWADNRAGEIADQFRETVKGNEFYHKTGVPIHAMSPFSKLLWLKENDTGIFKRAYKFIGIKEYIFFRLFGKYLIDTGIASATGLLNIRSLHWDQDILQYAGIAEEQLSAVVPATHFEYLPEQSMNATNRLQALKRAAFVIGGSDGALANLGSGAINKNSMAITIGTSSAVRMVATEVYTDKEMRTFCYHLTNSHYIIGGASNNGAVVLQWLKDTLLQTKETHEQLFTEAEKIPAGCNGLLFIPYIMGERAPVWNEKAKAVFFGLDITHTKSHLVRAAIEGVVYSVYSIGKILMENSNVKEIHATGGFTQSPLWIQMLCDMFNRTVIVSDAVESSALGAVKIGLGALQIDKKWTPETPRTYQPDTPSHKLYLQQFDKFERIYQALKTEMGTVVS